MANQNNQKNSNTFINPYNFVSVPKEYKCSNNTNDISNRHTGYLECELLTKTQLAIPDSEKVVTSNKHKIYPFYSYDSSNPVIPGSTIRGCLRSMYEALTDSCYSTNKPNDIVTRRTPHNRAFQPGLLEVTENGCQLFDAKRVYVRVVEDRWNKEEKTFDRKELEKLGYGAEVSYEYDKNKLKIITKNIKGKIVTEKHRIATNILPATNSSNTKGYLQISNKFSSKKYDSIFIFKKQDNKEILIKSFPRNDVLDKLEKVKEMYTEHPFTKINFSNINNKVIPIWYKKDGRNLYMSPSQIGRYAYDTRFHDIIKDRKPCINKNNCCKACSLFGMVAKDGSKSGKIRISDAVGLDTIKMSKNITLDPLGSPKQSYLPFYLVDGKKLGYDEDDVQIRGRKFYWHYDHKLLPNQVKKTELNATMDLVEKDSRFVFKIYYDSLSDSEIEELMWTVTLGENDIKSPLCYKIGHGKPLGLGSVKIIIKNRVEREYESEYKVDEKSLEVKKLFTTSACYEEIMKISNFEALAEQYELVGYPKVKGNEEKGFFWYTKNKNPNLLPGILDKQEISLSIQNFNKNNGRKK